MRDDRVVDPDGWLDRSETDTTFTPLTGVPIEDAPPPPAGGLGRVNWPAVRDYLAAGELDKLRSWCRSMWKVDPDDVLAAAYDRWPEFEPAETQQEV